MPAGLDEEGSGALASPYAVKARAISKTFGATVALDDVTLAVRPGVSHALVGRNGAGKSTLVGVLTGLLEPDTGTVHFNGEPAPDRADRDLWRQKVACVYQQSTIIDSLSVAENLFLNAFPKSEGRLLSWKAIRRKAHQLMDEWGIDASATTPASELSVGQRQQVEIARALRLGSRLIILDEPTAQLEAREINYLFEQIRRMQDSGVTFLYISHHLDEIYEVCREVSVLRDGRRIITSDVKDLNKGALVEAMVGSDFTPQEVAHQSDPAGSRAGSLDVRGLSLGGAFENVTFSLKAGEVVGLAGLAGSGIREVADALVGLLVADDGEVLVSGTPTMPGRVDRAIEDGISYVPEDRHARGFCPNLSVQDNLTSTILSRLGNFGIVEPSRRRAIAAGLVDDIGIVTASLDQLTSELSGGNQQKTVMGRALASDPSVLVLIHPTAGVDIASTETLLGAIVGSSLTVLLVSDELDELAVCDRVVVMFAGRVTSEFPAGWEGQELVAAIEGVQ